MREALLDQKTEDLVRTIKSGYYQSVKNIIKEIFALYQKIQNGQGVLDSHLYAYNRFYKLFNNLNVELTKLGEQQIRELGNAMYDLYVQNDKIIQEFRGFTTDIPEEIVKTAINAVWCSDGLMWSNRIWRNKDLTLNMVQNGIIEAVAVGKSSKKVARDLSKALNVQYWQAERLIRTELAHVQIQSTLDSYIRAGITHYRFLTAKDDRVCEEDKELAKLNGGIYAINEAKVGVNLPPIHPNCRCQILAVVN